MIPAGKGISARPVCLVEITLGNSGPVLYFSDRGVSVGGRAYEDYLEDLSGVGDELRRADSGGLNPAVTLRFRNDRYGPYGYLIEVGEEHPFEGAECVIKEAYLDDAGAPSEAETVFKGVLDEPRDIDLAGFTCSVSSMLMRADKEWSQKVVDLQDWPSAWEDVGKVVPILYGSPLLVPALRVDWGARTTLQAEVSAAAQSLELSDGERFPASGDIWIDGEKIGYSGRSGDALTGLARGKDGTQATPHRAGADVWEARARYDSLLAEEELYGVGKIYAEVQGRLWRVTSGVSAVAEGGRQILRATDRIWVHGLKDDISISDTITVEDTIGVNDQIAIDEDLAVSDTIGVSQGSHSHGTESQSTQFSTTGFPQVREVDNACTDSVTQGYPAFAGQRDRVVYRISVSIDMNGAAANYPRDRMTVKAGCGGIVKKSFTPPSSETGFDIQFSVLPGESGLDADTSFVAVYCDSAYGKFFNSVVQVNSAQRIIYSPPPSSAAAGVAKTGAAVKTGSVYKTGSVLKTGGAYKAGTVTRQGFVISTHIVDRFHAALSGARDPDGNYGGAGSLIERPDLVIKHFLVRRAGFSLEDVDQASFDAAGAGYASAIPGGYRFAFCVDGEIRPSEFLRRLAFECRSTLRYERGKWRLDFLPEAAPAPAKTVRREDLAGEFAGFTFSRTPWLDIGNDLTARFKRDYSRLGQDSEWLGTARASDAASQAKFGRYPLRVDLEAVRLQAMADDLLVRVLRERKAPLLRVEFPVFWEHFDLRPGDTVEIENPLYGGRRFYIERVRRTDRFRAEVSAVEWW
ncbi:MAG: hypothetical protein Kow0025_12080 [Thermodesulfovibrionales bacterium]